MRKNYSQLLTGILIGFVLGIFIGKQFSASPATNTGNEKTITNPANKPTDNQNTQVTNTDDVKQHEGNVPEKALNVLKYVRANGTAMDGYVGGRVFTNREGLLPQQDENGNNMQFQEWDVNPKIEGQNRGTQRLITSKNGRAWYTGDHYQTFIEIK